LRRSQKPYTPIPLIRHQILYAPLVAAYAAAVHHHPEEEQRALVVRVRKVVGQLNSVERMLEEDRDCAEVLTQIVSARRGLKSLAEKLIHSHVHTLLEKARDPTHAKKKLRDLVTVLERYVE